MKSQNDVSALEKTLIYLYCVTKRIPKLKNIDEGEEHIYFIYHQGFYGVVSCVSAEEFSEENLKKNLANLGWIEKKASRHEMVIEEVMKNTSVIPFKLGTLFKNEDNLRKMLETHRAEFQATLNSLEGKEEWGVKIYCEIERLKKDLLEEDQGLLNIDKEISSSSAGKAFLLKKKKEELFKRIVNKRLNECGQEGFEELKQYSHQSRINRLLPKEATERKEDMILNSVFLIEKNRVPDFVHRVNFLKETYGPQGFLFDCTGPWPPYHFCSIDQKVEQEN